MQHADDLVDVLARDRQPRVLAVGNDSLNVLDSVVEIDTDEGKVTWDIRGKSPTSLIREGWTPKTIQEGDQISVHGHLGRDGRKLMSIISITLADGTTLGLEY